MSTSKAPELKKGEVNELHTLLRNTNASKDAKKKRDVMKKVIAYMTLGIDVSRLFADVVLASTTKDLVVKKMVYLYLSNYARSNPDLTIMVINTLHKDCRDEDPMIRGLALRALTSLRLLDILEYVISPLKQSLSDNSGYVRQNAVIGILKVFHLSPETIKESDMVDTLYNMIRDKDPQVVVNCLNVLNEILASEGGIAINQPIIHYLLNRIRDFSDWGQCTVITMVSKYVPSDEEELFTIMNLLDPWLRVSNSAVVFSTTKAFINLTNSLPDVQQQVYQRLKTPLLTLVSTATPEISCATLSHMVLIIEHAPGVFDEEFKQFFCRYNEPTYVKSLKLKILPRLSNEYNSREIVSELTEYVTGVDEDLSRQAVRAICEIAIRVPIAVDVVSESLLELVDMEVDYVLSEAVIVMQDLLRKYPNRATTIIPSVHRCLKRIEDPAGKSAIIWMIGEYGQLIDDAPYLLEPLIDAIAEEESPEVATELLTATLKLFFKRPPEMQKMMGRLFSYLLGDNDVNPRLHDRALLYYRLLRANVGEAASVIASEQEPIDSFYDEVSPEVRAIIFKEFNTLSVVYGKPASEFISAEHMITEAPQPTVASGVNSNDDDGLLGDSQYEEGNYGTQPTPVSAPAPVSAPTPAPAPVAAAVPIQTIQQVQEIDLFSMDFFGSPAPAPAAAPAAVSYKPHPVALEPQAFQALWLPLPVAATPAVRFQRLPALQELDAALRSNGFGVVANGDAGAVLKFFLYLQEEISGQYALIEFNVEKATLIGRASVKTNGGHPEAVSPKLVSSLQLFGASPA